MQFKLIFIGILFICMNVKGQEMPLGYIIQYQQNFDQGKNFFKEYEFRDSILASNIIKPQHKYLTVKNNKNTDSIIADLNSVLSGYIFGDFIINIDLKFILNDSASVFSIFYCIRDTLNYYKLNFSSIGNSNYTSNLYSVRKGKIVQIGENDSVRIVLNKQWNKIIMKRDVVQGTVYVFLENEKNLILKAKDRTFVMGYIGFGGINSELQLDNFIISGPTSIPENKRIFN